MQQNSDDVIRGARSTGHPGGRSRFRARALIALCSAGVALFLSIAASALADAENPLEVTHSATEIQAAEEEVTRLTDPQAAAELPHRDLGRDEAQELMEGVFGPLLESPAGIFDELVVEKFLSSNAAVVSADDLPEGLSGDSPGSSPGRSMLLESTVPLRAEDTDGEFKAVDLGLEGTFGNLQPSNPIVDVLLPSELGEGIQLPGSGVGIEVAGAPEDRAPSVVEDTVAFYPNVAEDTDLAVSPTPGGVETLTQIRSAAAPRSQTLEISLPEGGVLAQTDDGGAEATIDGRPLVAVRPPTATDAVGRSVPVGMAVEDGSLTLTVSPDADTAYPIAVDPYFQDTYNWPTTGYAGWTNNWQPGGINVGEFDQPSYGCSTYCYLKVSARPNAYAANLQSYWQYAVPRFFSDYENPDVHQRPTSWIQSFGIEQVNFMTLGDYQANPQALYAVSDQNGAWLSAMLKAPNQTGNYLVNMNNNHTAKFASFGLFAAQSAWMTTERYLLVGAANVVLGDDTPSSIGLLSPPTSWLNTEAKPFNFSVEDAGLGIYGVSVRTAGGALLGSSYLVGCTGSARNPCPRTLKGAQEGHTVPFNPSSLPQGANQLKFEASDPLGNAVTGMLEVMVDHTAPTLALSGTMTEQAALGKTLPQYTLRTEAKDGTAASPQSGVVKTEIRVDGKVVSTDPAWSPGCSSQNCALTKEWTLKASEYPAGKHWVDVKTIDGAGIKSATKTIPIELEPDTTKPTLSGSGSLISGPEGWVEQKSYSVTGVAEDPKGYGTTTIQLKIDGGVVGTTTKACPAGSCSLTKAFTVNTAGYKGGEHLVKLVATDGAGNTTEKQWEIHVDPKGQISAGEATETLESFEETTDEQPVASTEEFLEPGIIEAGDDPGFVKVGNEYEATGVPITATVGATPSEGFSIEGEDGEIQVTPVSPGAASEVKLAGETAVAVGPSASTGVDTLIRPEFNGLMNFQAIREPASPEKFSWQVGLGAGQTLQSVDAQHAQVVYASGNVAFLITAEPAHDATGKGVPTHIEVSGSVLTLVVEHKVGGVVYPVVAGAAYETSYIPPTVIEDTVYSGPPVPEEGDFPPPRPWTQQQGDDAVALSNVDNDVVPAPRPGGSGGGTFTLYRSKCGKSCDRYNAKVEKAEYEVFPWGSRWKSGTEVEARIDQAWYWKGDLLAEMFNCGSMGKHAVDLGSNEHLFAYGHFNVTSVSGAGLELGLPTFKPLKEINFSLQAWVYPNGLQEKHVVDWSGQPNDHVCPRPAV